MKRFLMALLVLLMLGNTALAEEVIQLPDAVVTFTPLENAYLLTRESSASEFNRLGLSQRELLPWMEQYDVYAIMWDLETGGNFHVVLEPSEDEPLESMTDAERAEICAGYVAASEEGGYFGGEAEVYEGEAYLFIQLYTPMPDNAGVIHHVTTMYANQRGYFLLVKAFMPEKSGAGTAKLRVLADSVRISIPEDMTELSADGVSIRMTLPAGWTSQEEAAGLNAAPEKTVGELIGTAAAPDGSWYVQWQLIENVTGDLERLSASGLRALHEARAKQKKAAGFAVTAQEACTELRQVYVHLSYGMPGDWYAEEYYTKQSGWGVVVTAYSQGLPLTEEAHAVLLEMLSTQLIKVQGR